MFFSIDDNVESQVSKYKALYTTGMINAGVMDNNLSWLLPNTQSMIDEYVNING